MSEHTVEFYVVPRFKDLLQARFSNVLPMFFWSTREGNATSRASNSGGLVRLCALFPRRPKLGGSREVMMKVNMEVLEMARELQVDGVPTFAGIPIVRSLFDCAEEFPCCWFHLTASGLLSDCEVNCEQGTPPQMDGVVRGPCQHDEVIRLVESQSRRRSWEATIETIRDARSRGEYRRFRPMFGQWYKPVYFLFW